LIVAVFYTNKIKYANGVVNMPIFRLVCTVRQLPRSWLKHVTRWKPTGYQISAICLKLIEGRMREKC